jgi:hypothetical protein
MFFFSAFLLLLNVVTAVAQETITIKGNIVDAQTNETIIGAVILLNGGEQGSVSDADGNFVVEVKSFPASIRVSYLERFRHGQAGAGWRTVGDIHTGSTATFCPGKLHRENR